MDPPNPHREYCSKHNKSIIGYQTDHQQAGFCLVCLQQQRSGFIPIEQLNQYQQELYVQVLKQFEDSNQILQQILEAMKESKEKLTNFFENFISDLVFKIELINQSKEKFKDRVQNTANQLQRIEEIEKASAECKKKNREMGLRLEDLFLKFREKLSKIFEQPLRNLKGSSIIVSNNQNSNQSINQFNKLINNLNKNNRNNNQGINQNINQNNYQNINQNNYQNNNSQNNFYVEKYQYKERRSEYQIQFSNCRSFTFNKDNSNLFIGCNQEIIVCEFFEGKIGRQLQCLSNHTSFVFCLQFIKRSNSLVSGSSDQSIIIWNQDSNKKWITEAILQEHLNAVACLLLNKNEDLLFSGSFDKTVRLWKFEFGRQWNKKQALLIDNEVRNMSLNETENKLIICSNNRQGANKDKRSSIQIFSLDMEKQWNEIQKLSFDYYGYRLCFTINDQFIFTTEESDQLYIYGFDEYTQKFQKVNEIQISKVEDDFGLFPCQFVSQFKIIAIKLGKTIYIIRIDRNGRYELRQQIRIKNSFYFGRLSEDGKYLIVCDGRDGQILSSELE